MGLIDRLSDILKSRQNDNKQEPAEPSPQQLLREAIVQLQNSLQRTDEAVKKAVQNKNSVARQLTDYRNQAKQLQYDASAAMKAGNEHEARNILARKANTDEQAKQFEQIYAQACETSHQVETQYGKLKLQLEELKAKELMLSAKLESAGAQRDINLILNDLDNNGLQMLESQVIQAQLESSEGGHFDLEFERLEKEQKQKEWQAQLEREQKELEEKQKEQQNKKIAAVFGQTADREKELLKAKEAEVLREREKKMTEFLAAKNEPPQASKPKNIADFFENTPAVSEKPKASLDDFFAEKKNAEPQDFSTFFETKNTDNQEIAENKNVLVKQNLDEFFGKEPTKNDKKSKIDDFFANDEK